MIYKVIHKTSYDYYKPLSLCHNVAHLVPRDTEKQVCKKYHIEILPAPAVLEEYTDFFGNKVFYFSIEQEHSDLTVTVTSEIEKIGTMTVERELFDQGSWQSINSQLLGTAPDHSDVRQYIAETNMTASDQAIHNYALISFTPGRSFFEAAKELMHRIFRDFQFVPGFTTISTPPAEVMRQRKGVCQDFAHLAIACIRSMGLPARYVSGYIETLPLPGRIKLVGVDASHAWYSVFVPHTGWVDFDPTNNQIPTTQHITVGWGRDYADVTPLKGVIVGNGTHNLTVNVDVRRKPDL